jgi:hypothetical protein
LQQGARAQSVKIKIRNLGVISIESARLINSREEFIGGIMEIPFV